jgi:soluble lytic murein transglycosylase-like protein
MSALGDSLNRLDSLYRRDVAPLVRLLQTRHPDEAHVQRIAFALAREGRNTGVDPRLLVSVLLVENPRLDPEAVSFMGAVGLMQVMPFHAGGWGCPSPDLTDVDANICHGARILAHELRRAKGNLDVALLRYNGCVLGTNTPDCHLYPMHVFRSAFTAWLNTP